MFGLHVRQVQSNAGASGRTQGRFRGGYAWLRCLRRMVLAGPMPAGAGSVLESARVDRVTSIY